METFNKCLQALQSTKSDNEKLASLMIISKIIPSIDVDKKLAEDLYQAVTINFILRLLKSSAKEDENAIMFQQLAVNILSTVAKINPSIVLNNSVLVERLLAKLKEFDSSHLAFYCDLLELLTILAAEKEGYQLFLKQHCFDDVSTLLVSEDAFQKASLLFTTLLKHNKEELTKEFVMHLHRKSEKLMSTQELDKFRELDILTQVFKIMCNLNMNFDLSTESIYQTILKNLVKAVQDLLKSRIKAEYKQTVVILCSYIIQVFGSNWILGKEAIDQNPKQFILLMLTVVLVELSCFFNLKIPVDEIDQSKDVIVSCLSIEKTVLSCICQDTFENDDLAKDNDFIVKVFRSFENTMKSVFQFLKYAGTANLDSPVVFEALKMVCVWATEETDHLRDELKSVIPMLLDAARKFLNDNCQVKSQNLLVVMAPCIAQLLPDDVMRHILVTNKCLQLFLEYCSKLLSTMYDNTKKNTESIECILHIFHEFLILDNKYCCNVIWSNTLIDDLIKLCLTCCNDKPVLSMYSVCELIVLLLRLQRLPSAVGDYKLDVLLPTVLDFMYLLTDGGVDFENTFGEIWVVAMQNIIEVVSNNERERRELKHNYDFESRFPKREGVHAFVQKIIQQLKDIVLS